jgi:phosphoenolpyruvate carboxykinase (ATP)
MTRVLDLDDESLTENTRAAYPLDFIPNAVATGSAAMPKNVVMLTADAFGVLPPIARLTAGAGDVPLPVGLHRQGRRHREVASPSRGDLLTCFGAPFMPRHPEVYGNLLREKIAATRRGAGWSTPAGPADTPHP